MSEAEKPKFRRNYRACLNCRIRKVKCDLGSVDNPVDGKCARCRRERKDCVFADSRRGGKANILSGKRKRSLGSDDQGHYEDASLSPRDRLPSVSAIMNEASSAGVSPGYQNAPQNRPDPRQGLPEAQNNHSLGPKENQHFSTMEGALVFLAKAAGSIAKADERDNIDADKKHQQLEENMSQRPSIPSILNDENGQYEKLLSEKPAVPKHIQDQSNYLSIPISNEFSIRPKGSNKLSNIDYIGEDGLLTEYEAEMLVNLFFTTMHPYFPFIPNFLHTPSVLAGYPILLCAILTISSRYHTLEDRKLNESNSVPRNIEIHDKLWLYVQRLISQTVWAEASTRSIGTIFAFLLLTEWNPRAIHWRWSDYANRPEDEKEASQEPQQAEQNLAGLGAMRRSYRMAWMLIGSAVRLAQDMGVMEVSSKIFLSTHISEINSVMNISRRSMLASSLAEIDLDDDNEVPGGDPMRGDDDDQRLLDMTEDEIKEYSLSYPLKFTYAQRAKIELLQIMSLGHESLYGYKAQLGSLTQRQNLSILNILSPLINNWARKYRKLLRPSTHKQFNLNSAQLLLDQNSKLSKELADCIEYEGFIFEFNYAKLYIYSLALSSTPKTEQESNSSKKQKRNKINLKLDEISKSAKYIEQAFYAANEMLSVAHRVHKLKMLRFMPVRWVTRIVRAVAFIVKCYLTITAHKKSSRKNASGLNSNNDNFEATILSLSLISMDEITVSIHRAAITLRDCSPDELHLCTRYSNVLLYLCSEMKTNSKNFDDNSEYDTNTSSRMGGNGGYFSMNPSSFSTHSNSETNLNTEYEHTGVTPTEVSTPLQNLIGDSEVMEWFINNKNIGLDFVAPWTEMIEQQLTSNDQFSLDPM